MVDATVSLFKDIGMDVTYKFVPLFTSKTIQRSWFMSKQHDTYNCNYNKIQNLLYINDSQWGNFLEYTYALLDDVDDSGRTYYAWVRNVALIDTETVAIELDIDPIQNRMCEWSIGESFVSREHVDRWNPNGYLKYYKANTDNPTALMNYQNANAQAPISSLNGTDVFYITIVYRKTVTSSENETVYVAEMPVAYDGVTKFQNSIGSEYYPMWYEVMDGSIIDTQNIDPANVLCIAITQFCPFIVNITSENRVYFTTADGTNFTGYQRWQEITLTEQDITTVLDMFQEYTLDITVSKATAPSDGDTASYLHEPKLYQSPYFKRYLVNGCGSVQMDIGDAVVRNADLELRYKAVISPSSQNLLFDFIEEGDTQEQQILSFSAGTLIGSSIISNVELADVYNDQWASYRLTSRNTDRQMVVNSAIANTITSTIGMGYGGALVGSRSASGSFDSDERRNQLLNSGARSAIAMASGAGVAMSIVDAGMAWENQLAKERGIQNSPMTVAQVGTNGIYNMLNNIGQFGFVELRCDDVTFQTAYDNYRKYGYEVSRFETPNINSRKYYNYIQTVYCKINGALTGDEKDTISRIINNGVTFVHMDYSSIIGYPTDTSGYELENIERSLIT